MQKSVIVKLAIPARLAAELKADAAARGMTQSQVVTRALAMRYFGMSAKKNVRYGITPDNPGEPTAAEIAAEAKEEADELARFNAEAEREMQAELAADAFEDWPPVAPVAKAKARFRVVDSDFVADYG